MEKRESKSLIQKLKEHGKFVRFDHSKGFIYSMNDCLYAFSKDGLHKL